MKKIIGDTSKFAIESGISQAFERRSFLALGFFLIHVGGVCYGVRDDQATMLSSPLQKLNRILRLRGLIQGPELFEQQTAAEIFELLDSVIFEGDQRKSCQLVQDSFDVADFLYSSHAAMHHGCDEAFDDGSVLYYFPFQNKVRIIAALSGEDTSRKLVSIRDIWITSDEFYGVIKDWRDFFQSEWLLSTKVPESEDQLP